MTKLFLLILLFLSQGIFPAAQNLKDSSSVETLIKLDFGFQGIGFSFEPKLSNKTSIDLSAGLGGGYDISEDGLFYELNIFPSALYFSAVPKFYYNRQKRSQAGKSNKLNSGNYIGARVRYISSSTGMNAYLSDALLLNAHWGLQRTVGRRVIFNTHIGVGYAQNLENKLGTIYPALDFKFSYVLSKINK